MYDDTDYYTYTNEYNCCAHVWTLEGCDSMHDDKCGVCNKAIEPFGSYRENIDFTRYKVRDDEYFANALLVNIGSNLNARIQGRFVIPEALLLEFMYAYQNSNIVKVQFSTMVPYTTLQAIADVEGTTPQALHENLLDWHEIVKDKSWHGYSNAMRAYCKHTKTLLDESALEDRMCVAYGWSLIRAITDPEDRDTELFYEEALALNKEANLGSLAVYSKTEARADVEGFLFKVLKDFEGYHDAYVFEE